MTKDHVDQLVKIWLSEVADLTEHFEKLKNPLEFQSIGEREKEEIDKLAKKAEKLIKEVQVFLDEKKDIENFANYIDQLTDINERLAKFHPRVH